MKRSILNCANRLKFLNALILVFGIIALTIAHAELAPAKSAEPIDSSWQGRVVGITDGDTITVLSGTEQVKIRIYGIDAPERTQAFGTKSRQFLASLVFGCNITIKPTGKDIYGRTIARIYHEDRDIGLAMIASGYAWWYQQYAKKDIDYKNAQAKAKRQQLGLWADPDPVEPAKFRKIKKGK